MPENNAVKVLVTGAAGMQGGAAARALLQAGHEVTAFVRKIGANRRTATQLSDQPADLMLR